MAGYDDESDKFFDHGDYDDLLNCNNNAFDV